MFIRMVVAASAVLFFGELAMAYEEPAYEVVAENDSYEVRRYAPYLVAETKVQGGFKAAGNEAFRRLAGYIFGKNRSAERMQMTVPVASMSGEPEKIAMTTPVVSTTSNTAHIYYFIMPTGYTVDNLPMPEDERIQFRQVPARYVAARRYSGRWTERGYRKNEAALINALEQDGVEIVGEPQFARYNGPFTPWFMRRNEVLIDLADGDRFSYRF